MLMSLVFHRFKLNCGPKWQSVDVRPNWHKSAVSNRKLTPLSVCLSVCLSLSLSHFISLSLSHTHTYTHTHHTRTHHTRPFFHSVFPSLFCVLIVSIKVNQKEIGCVPMSHTNNIISIIPCFSHNNASSLMIAEST